jgi:hypothetical protein
MVGSQGQNSISVFSQKKQDKKPKFLDRPPQRLTLKNQIPSNIRKRHPHILDHILLEFEEIKDLA